MRTYSVMLIISEIFLYLLRILLAECTIQSIPTYQVYWALDKMHSHNVHLLVDSRCLLVCAPLWIERDIIRRLSNRASSVLLIYYWYNLVVCKRVLLQRAQVVSILVNEKLQELTGATSRDLFALIHKVFQHVKQSRTNLDSARKLVFDLERRLDRYLINIRTIRIMLL